MDKGLRNKTAKLKQKQRLKTHSDISWMNDSKIGSLKNHDDHYNGLRPKKKYKKAKYKNIEDDE